MCQSGGGMIELTGTPFASYGDDDDDEAGTVVVVANGTISVLTICDSSALLKNCASNSGGASFTMDVANDCSCGCSVVSDDDNIAPIIPMHMHAHAWMQ